MTQEPTSNNNKALKQWGATVVLSGISIVGGLAALYVFKPEEGAKEVVLAVITGILGFLAGRKA